MRERPYSKNHVAEYTDRSPPDHECHHCEGQTLQRLVGASPEARQNYATTWIGIGAGAVAAGVVAILVLGNGDEPETLADPPVRP